MKGGLALDEHEMALLFGYWVVANAFEDNECLPFRQFNRA
jgi:hypothetical protein